MPGEALERAVGDVDLLAGLEGDDRARPLHALLDLVQHPGHFVVAHRRRLALRPEEAGDPVDRVDQVVGAVGHLHPHQHVAGHEPLLGLHLLAAADLDDLLGRHHHLGDLVLRGPCCAAASLIASATFFSKFESTLTEYQRIAMFFVRYPNSPTVGSACALVGAARSVARNENGRATKSARAAVVRPEALPPYAPAAAQLQEVDALGSSRARNGSGGRW